MLACSSLTVRGRGEVLGIPLRQSEQPERSAGVDHGHFGLSAVSAAQIHGLLPGGQGVHGIQQDARLPGHLPARRDFATQHLAESEESKEKTSTKVVKSGKS